MSPIAEGEIVNRCRCPAGRFDWALIRAVLFCKPKAIEDRGVCIVRFVEVCGTSCAGQVRSSWNVCAIGEGERFESYAIDGHCRTPLRTDCKRQPDVTYRSGSHSCDMTP